MNNLPQSNTCPQCRAVLPADAPQGLCPACLLAAVALPTEAGAAAPAKAPPPTREQVAAVFPQLEILELIGTGGMGHVFKARQPKLDRLVALKLLPQSLAADPAFAGRFEREGRILARLSHSNIVTVHDFGFARAGDLQSPPPPATSDPDGDCKSPAPPLSTLNPQLSTSQTGFYYLLMEFVDGVNLRQAMRAGRFTPVQALEVVPKICEALQFAHEQGILHRDIKPENILLDARGRVKLVDFGIAKLVDDGRAELPLGLDAEAAQQRGATTLTSATAALGTPSYMAPEQRDRPADVDHRADIYSLGVVFYEMLTGELPVGKFAPPSTKSASDPRVDEVVLRALEQQRERRQQSAGEVKTQVETIASSPGSSRREEAQTIRQESSASPAARALSPALRWSLIAVIVYLFVSGCYAAWTTMRVFGRGEIGLNLGVLLLPAAIGLHRRRAGWRICALAFLWFGAVFAVITAASQLTHPHEPVIRLGGTPMSAGATWWQSALLAAGFWWLARVLSQQQIRAQFATARPKSGWREWAVLLAALLVAYAGSHVFPPRPASAVTHFGCVSVGVSNNVVIVDVNTEVWLQSVELRAELTGPRLSSATEAAARALIPAFSGTFVHPTPHTSNAPSRILPTGRHTWRIGFVLPSAAQAQEAERNLRRIGPLRAEPGRTSAGTLFEVRQPDGVTYRASLQVATTNHFAQTTTAPSLIVVGSLRLIAGGAHRNVAIASAESLTGHPLHEVVARFAGPAISSNSWLHARSFGPTLGPAQDERLGEGWRGEPVDSQTIWSQSDTLTPASSTRFFCPNECQLQFALEDDAEAVEASRQIRAALSQDVPLVVGKRVQLFRVGEREAWLEVRPFQSVPGKLAVFSGPNRRSGRSPVHLAGTDRIDSAVLAIPPNSELTLTGFLYDGIPTAPPPALFTTSLTNSASQPGLYWLTWRTGHDLPPSNASAETGWQFHVHDGLTAKELHRFQSPATLNFKWQMRWAYQSNSVMPSVGLLQTLLTFGNAGDRTGSNRYRAILVDATMKPLPTKRSPE